MGPAAGRRGGQLRPQGCLRRYQSVVLPGNGSRQDDGATRLHAGHLQPRSHPVHKARHALDDQAKWSSGRSRAGLGDARDVDGNSRIRPRSPAQV